MEYTVGMSLLWLSAAAAAGAAMYTNPLPQPGDAGYRPSPVHHVRLVAENDSGFGNDSNYTSGVRLDYTHSLDNGDAWGASITQNIYTPERHSGSNVRNEQPYAGLLSLGAGYILRGDKVGCTTEFQLGTTGNASLAHSIQNSLHSAGGMTTWDGWGAQVPSEVTFQLTSQQDYRLPSPHSVGKAGWETDASLYTREELGTVFISGGVGCTFRMGHNLPDSMVNNGNRRAAFGISSLRKPKYNRSELSYFLVADAYVAYVARDLAIDGGVFHSFEQTCSRTPWQAELRLGVGASYKGIDYYAGGLFYTERYRTQRDPGCVGCFSVTWHW